MPMARISWATPSFSKRGVLAGNSDSPMWKRGWASFSSSTTLWPRSARRAAVVDPPGPPPITTTSQSFMGEIIIMGMRIDRIAIATIALLAGGCAAAPPDGYTCCNLHYDYDRISDANWRNLPMIPAGAKIRVVQYGVNQATVEIDGKPIKIAHDYGRDRESLETYVRKLIVQQDPKALIASYPLEVRDAIFRGIVIQGMTREQVIIAAGYPPT